MVTLQSHAHKPWHLSAVLLAAAALRLAIFCFTALPAVLETRPELSTPITSFRNLREGVYIYQRRTNPYNGGIFHHSPIYLAWFTYVVPASSPTLTAIFWTLADLAGAWGLVKLWSSRSKHPERRTALVALLYLFNPYTLLTCLARSTTSIDNAMLLSAISLAVQGEGLHAAAMLSLCAHTSLYPLLLLPALCVTVRHQRSAIGCRGGASSTLSGFLAGFVSIAAFNQMTLGTAWMKRTWLVILSVSDLTPNVGMWWYFVTEMFDHFRPFFVGVFHLHTVIYVAPVCLRMKHDPTLAMVIITGIFSTWKSYPTLGDLAVWAGLLGCFPEIISNLRHPLFTLTVYLYTLLLLPMLHSLWLLTGTGNANFFYAATMVHGLNSSLAIVDVVGASIRANTKAAVAKQLVAVDTGETDLAQNEDVFETENWRIIQLNKVD